MELIGQERNLGISDLVKFLNWKKSTVHRLASTLEDLGYLEQAPDTLKYRLSLKLFSLGNLTRSNRQLRDQALPYMQALAKKTGEAINLGILDRTEVVFIEQVESKHLLQPVARVGSRAPLYCTAIGRVLLASLADEEVNTLVSETSIKKYTEKTITSLPELKRILDKVRRLEYALDDEESHTGVRSVAAAISGEGGRVVAGISIVGPTARLDSTDLKRIVPALKRAADSISRSIA